MSKSLHALIRERFQLGPASHMTHLDNLRAIIQGGGVQCLNKMRATPYVSLANPDVQRGRAQIVVPTTGRPLHDYVPLYFGFKTPMAAWSQQHNENLIFLRVSLDILAKPGVVFTDGNARAKGTKFISFTTVNDLSTLDVKAILTAKYAHDLELKRRKQAEILVPEFLALDDVLDIICYSMTAARQVVQTLQDFGIKKAVMVNKGWYFHTPPPEKS